MEKAYQGLQGESNNNTKDMKEIKLCKDCIFSRRSNDKDFTESWENATCSHASAILGSAYTYEHPVSGRIIKIPEVHRECVDHRTDRNFSLRCGERARYFKERTPLK